MNAEAILQESWQLFRKHWRYLSLIAAVNFVTALVLSFAVLVLGILPTVDALLADQAGRFIATLISGAVFGVLAALIAPLLIGSAAVAARQVIRKKPTDLIETYREVFVRYRTLLPLMVVVGTAILGGTLLFAVPGLIALVLFACSPYLALTESGTTMQLLSRSIKIAKAHVVTILILLLVLGAISFTSTFLINALPFAGSFLAGYLQSILSVFGLLVFAVFCEKASAK
jgi:hypothetical protein